MLATPVQERKPISLAVNTPATGPMSSPVIATPPIGFVPAPADATAVKPMRRISFDPQSDGAANVPFAELKIEGDEQPDGPWQLIPL
jgi:hypothetical protein